MLNKRTVIRPAAAGNNLEPLEQRILWSASPLTAAPTAALTAAPATRRVSHVHAAITGVTDTDRQFILDHWQRGPEQKKLQNLLNADISANDNGVHFDNALLSYMLGQFNSGVSHYFFTPSQVAADINLIQDPNNNYGQPFQKAWTNVMLNARTELSHVFDGYQEPATINWLVNPSVFGANTNFIHSLNNMAQFVDFAEAYRFSPEPGYTDAGNPEYVQEIQNELISWAQQDPPLANPNDYHKTSPEWWLLDTTGRVRNWLMTYSLLIGTPAFTPALNTLFIKEFYLNGEFMDQVTPDAPTSNTVVNQGVALEEVATVFPQFAASSQWYSDAINNLITPTLEAQFFSDGVQDEESPGYAKSVLSAYGEAYYLNHTDWPSDALTILDNAANAYYQELEPDGTEPPLGDTVTAISADVLGPLQIELGESGWTQAKLRMPSVFIVGAANAISTLHDAADPALVNRGLTDAQPVGGDYIMRSGESGSANQLIFTAGPTAAVGSPHGHYDLLSFDLFGNGQSLINDPGVDNYVEDAERDRLISTPAADTISINGQNHAFVSPADASKLVKVEQWSPNADNVQVTAQQTAYQGVPGVNGNPVLTRSIFYDYSNTYMVVDFANATETNTYNVGYNLVGNTAAGPGGSIHTTNSGENVEIVPVLLKGQRTASSATTVFTGAATAATYYSVSQKASSTIFASVVVTYMGNTPPVVTGKWASLPTATGAGILEVRVNGVVTETASFTNYFPSRRKRRARTQAVKAELPAANPATVWSAVPIAAAAEKDQMDSLFN